ncbi:tetratricopeptide repeat protein [Streptomyces phytohabitans]|uniref:tetratricopeptide repeat protein n=1 Tax=Streptomyces phytohabitans TaxID=1150371 RepID=UPI00345C0E1E
MTPHGPGAGAPAPGAAEAPEVPEAEALFAELEADAYGPDSDRALVPYARLLRLRAERPDAFGEDAAHRLHRLFKWAPGGLLGRPELPLAVLERWQAEAAHRHRLAEHSERAVRQNEFALALHTGDTARAARAHDAWLAADRDASSDCAACELHEQGAWQARLGDDAAALRIWAPLLDGTVECPYDPYAVLTSALLPLARTGRTDEARAAHHTGYRMVRALPDARRELAAHVEFCALTGNERRALAVLDEQARLAAHGVARWEPGDDPGGHLDWTVCVALLLRRLTGLGHAAVPVSGPPGREWTVVTLLEHAADEALALAGAFDARNGTTAVSDAVRARMAAEPLPGTVPLGLRHPPLGGGAAHGDAGHPDDASFEGADPLALLAEARRRSDEGHPSAPAYWRRAEDAVARAGIVLGDAERAELLDHHAMRTARTDPAAGAALFTDAAALFRAAGRQGDAVACQARAALATAFAGDTATALERIAPLCAQALALHTRGAAGVRQTTAVLLSRARIRATALAAAEGAADGGQDPATAPDPATTPTAAAVDAELVELIGFAEPHRAEPGVLARIAEATEARGRVAGQCGDPGAAARLLADATRAYHAADRPWQAVEAELALGRALLADGAAAEAENALRAVLRDSRYDGALTPAQHARVRLALAEAVGARSGPDEEVALLLEAARLADGAADGDGTRETEALAARARLRLGGAYVGLGRWAEAATVLENALPDLLPGAGPRDAVQARRWLGEALTGTGEPGPAADQFLAAAETAAPWTDQGDHAMLTHLAADALLHAGRTGEAEEAYARAERLWVPLGDTHAAVRALRSRAWIAVDGARVPEAIDLMEAALQQVEGGLRHAATEDERTGLRGELGQTYRQTAELLLRTTAGPPDEERDPPDRYDMSRVVYEEAVVFAEHAATAFGTCGPAGLDARAGAELLAAWLEIGLARYAAAAERAARVLDACPPDAPDPDGALESRRREAAAVLAEAGAPV